MKKTFTNHRILAFPLFYKKMGKFRVFKIVNNKKEPFFTVIQDVLKYQIGMLNSYLSGGRISCSSCAANGLQEHKVLGCVVLTQVY